jgi:hypothetical protein
MAILYDARGNPFQGSDDSIQGQVLVDTRPPTVTLAALNAETLIDLQGKATVAVTARSAVFTGTLLLEGSVDGTNYDITPIPLYNPLTETFVSSIVGSGVVTQNLLADVTCLRRIRLRASAYTSGSIAVGLRTSTADLFIYAKNIPSNLAITAVGAANAAVTATLPGVTGLFHYITNITLMRAATAALAGSAVLTHTTSNLPGSLAWSVGNAMVAGGTQIDLNLSPVTPLRSSAAGTATTITMPAPGAAVLNRINVTYYVGA